MPELQQSERDSRHRAADGQLRLAARFAGQDAGKRMRKQSFDFPRVLPGYCSDQRVQVGEHSCSSF